MAELAEQVQSGGDDVALMREIARGDAGALKVLYERHGGAVYTLAKRMIRDEGEAEQLLTDVFFELWNSRDRYDETRASPMTYIMRLTRSRAIDRLRKKRMVGTVALDPAEGIDVAVEEEPGSAMEAAEGRVVMQQAMRVLDREQRMVLESAYYEGLSHSEIAAKFGKPLGTVKSYIRTGLMRLREVLSQKSGGGRGRQGVSES